MALNADFSKRAAVHSATMDWTPSPMAGVERRMLDRIGEEVARATSIVRFAPGSAFSPHTHGGGEEFLVLEGVFSDEHGDFPAGSYIRNPPGSSHTPASGPGCTIFVKLWQFDPADRSHVIADTTKMRFVPVGGGVEVMPLFSDGREDVALERWDAGAQVALDAPDGLEILVLDGGFAEDGEAFAAGSWLRMPKGSRSRAVAGDAGATVWIKRDHLADEPEPPNA